MTRSFHLAPVQIRPLDRDRLQVRPVHLAAGHIQRQPVGRAQSRGDKIFTPLPSRFARLISAACTSVQYILPATASRIGITGTARAEPFFLPNRKPSGENSERSAARRNRSPRKSLRNFVSTFSNHSGRVRARCWKFPHLRIVPTGSLPLRHGAGTRSPTKHPVEDRQARADLTRLFGGKGELTPRVDRLDADLNPRLFVSIRQQALTESVSGRTGSSRGEGSLAGTLQTRLPWDGISNVEPESNRFDTDCPSWP